MTKKQLEDTLAKYSSEYHSYNMPTAITEVLDLIKENKENKEEDVDD